MKDKKRRVFSEIAVIACQTVLLVSIAVFSVFPISCTVTAEGIDIIGGDYTAPVLESVTVLDEVTLELKFSESVSLTDVVISPVIDGVSNSNRSSSNEKLSVALAAASGERGKIQAEMQVLENKTRFIFTFAENMKVGMQYEIFGVVHDSIGNSLTFCAPFVGFNGEVPKIIMTELQVKYQKSTSSKGVVTYKGEFVEFLALSDGNLAGLELVSASDGEGKKYEFPPVEVTKGQIFLVHLRTVGDGCVDERENLDEATAVYSKSGVLDLWSDSTVARLHDTTDVVILRNGVDGYILDAVMYAGTDVTEWKASIVDYAFSVCDTGIYETEDIANASISKGVTVNKSLNRVNSSEIYEQVMSGDAIEYPVMVTNESWVVKEVTAGTL